MSRVADLVNERFGRLLVLRRYGSNKNGRATWFCQCDCGQTKIIVGKELRSKHTKSCGCLQIDTVIARNFKHGLTIRKKGIPKEYRAWYNAKQRCTNIKNPEYHNYGGRGIHMCERWSSSFECFLQDMGAAPNARCTLDRINNHGDYQPHNCRWTTVREQSRNKRSNIMIGCECLSDYCQRTGKNYSTLRSRITVYGWSIAEAVNIPIGGKRYAR